MHTADNGGVTAGPADREFNLVDALSGAGAKQVVESLATLVPGPVAIVDASERVLAGTPGPHRQPLEVEWEVIGYLACGEADVARRKAASTLLERVLVSAWQVRLVSDLHHSTIESDFELLQEKHQALQASERRYRDLATQLERRVEEQLGELRESERRLGEARRLASVGHLAAGVAHEINNPLGFVTANLSAAHRYLEDFAAFRDRLVDAETLDALRGEWRHRDLDFVLEDFLQLIAESREGAGRINNIVSSLKGLTEIGGDDRETVALEGVLDQAEACLPARGVRSVALIRDIPAGIRLHAKSNLLAETLGQILLNGAQAMARYPDPRLQLRAAPCGENMLELSVRDYGEGMDATTREHAFDPFFTTRPVGTGTGLGLTVAREVVIAHGGDIRIDTEPGNGTTVVMRLPLAAESTGTGADRA